MRHRYCAIPFFEIQDDSHVFALYQNLKLFSQFVLENFRN